MKITVTRYQIRWRPPGCDKGRVQLSCWDQFSWQRNLRTSLGCKHWFLSTKSLFSTNDIAPTHLPPLTFLSSPLARASPGTNNSGKTLSRYLEFPIKIISTSFFFCFSPFEWLALEILPQLFSRRYVSIVAEVVSNPKLVTHVISASQNLSKKADIINLLNVRDECTS